ncbi:MAG: hypothetical protein WCL39_03020 [Armatimonadota bacterium]
MKDFFDRNAESEIGLDGVSCNSRFFAFIGDNQDRYAKALGYDFLREMRRLDMFTATRDAPAHTGGEVTYATLAEGVQWVKDRLVAYYTHWDNDQGRCHDYQGLGVEGYHDYLLAAATQANEQFGCRRVWINYGGEADSCFPWPVDAQFESKKAAYQYWRDRVVSKEERAECFAFWSGWFEHALAVSDGDIRSLPMIWTCAEVHDVHYWFEWGVPFITFETNCWRSLPLNVQIAFTRGAARQHNSLWGIDVSLWNWPGRLTTYNKLGEWISGNTAEYYLRQWMLSYMAGANAVHFEIASSQVFTEKGRNSGLWPEEFSDEEAAQLIIEENGPQEEWFSGGGTLVSSKTGNNAIDFCDFSTFRHKDRGEPVTALGVMLDYHHGWGSSASFAAQPDSRVMWREMLRPRVWGDCVKRSPGDDSTDAFFRTAFQPFFKDITKDSSTAALDDRDIFEAFWEGRLDPEDYLPGLADTRWGNSLEVILDNASPNVLSQYPNLLLLGDVNLGNEQWDRLLDYTASGGNLILSVAQVDDYLAKKLDLGNWRSQKPGIAHNTVWRDETGRCGANRLMYHETSSPGAETVIRTDGDDILLLRFATGKGCIYLSAVPHYLDLDSNIAPHLLIAMDRLIKDAMPAYLLDNSIDYSVSADDTSLTVTILNHHGTSWRGDICVKKDALGKAGRIRATDIWRDRDVRAGRIEEHSWGWKVDVGIRPRSLSVIRIQAAIQDKSGRSR